MVTAVAWRQMVAYFPNLKDVNVHQRQAVQIKQPLSAKKIRLWLANDFSTQPLEITAMTVAQPNQKKVVTVNGKASFQVPAHARLSSDWVDFPIQAGDWLTVTIASPNRSPQTLAQTLDQTLVRAGDAAPYFYGIVGIEVARNAPIKSLLFFGDSLTNQGYYSAALTRQLMTQVPDQWGITNGGLSGNRLLRPGHSTSVWSPSFGAAGLERLTKLLDEQHFDWLIFMEGINDLLHPGNGSPVSELPSAADLIAGIQRVIILAKQHGVRLNLATITPFKGGVIGGTPAWNATKEGIRQQVNAYLRSLPNTLDFDQLVATADRRVAPAFDCGDHIHFSAAGGALIADYIVQHLAIG